MLQELDREIRGEVSKILATSYLKYKERRLYRAISRIFDVILASLVLFVTFPTMIIIAGLIFFSNGGPILFKQKRLGKNGKPFTIYKFRTMRKDAEIILKEDKDLYKKYIENDYKLPPNEDPRLVNFGGFLRSSSLDELPQLFNVLRGDMSHVGPRPIVPAELERYSGHEREFLSVTPGLTGLWQVSGRSDIEYPQRKYLDLLYVENQSLFLDFKILVKTAFIVLSRSGAH
ncbi:MAG: sugar transferase [Balneolaceae bacterium]|nr:sugar transferase [Balneolaceae bacterium]